MKPSSQLPLWTIGAPLGTLALALAVTLIEVALIVSLMAAGGEQAAGLARSRRRGPATPPLR